MRNPKLLLKLSLLLLLGLMVAAHSEEPPVGDCAHDYPISVQEASGDLWSAYGGQVTFREEGNESYVRLTFRADPAFLRFDRDASLRVRTAFACRPGERPLAIEADIRTSATLAGDAELNDIMLLGKTTRMLPGAGIRAAGEWQHIRIAVPPDAGDFTAVHFGAGAGWARERPGEMISMDLRNIRLLRSRPLFLLAGEGAAAARWLDPERPDRADARTDLLVAPGAPVFTLVEIPGHQAGSFRWTLPRGAQATVWHADWIWTEQKSGVAGLQPIRLQAYSGAEIPASLEHPHQFWIRIASTGSGGRPEVKQGELVVTLGGTTLRRPIRLLPVSIPLGSTQFQMYYQMNENWTGYAKYAAFYRNAAGHFQQLADLGFTGIHLADEPKYTMAEKRLTADFSTVGRYWQKWPLPLGQILAAADQAGFHDPLVWEGLRIFTRDDVWSTLAATSCRCDGAPMHSVEQRLPELAHAAANGWRTSTRMPPVMAIADEPGVHSADEVRQLVPWLKALRKAGFRNYLTTHTRLHDSFHQLAPWLDINVLHAEDVTSGASAFVRGHQGRLWLYNGGSMNVGAPVSDRFFAGLYGWLAGAEGITQWIYTRPSELSDPLDLRTRLLQDAQFYALPGIGSEPAATPGLLGLSAGIADRRLLDYAATSSAPRVQAILRELRETNQLPDQFDEYAVARLRSKAALAGVRDRLLLALAP